jgi:hypothetical protein
MAFQITMGSQLLLNHINDDNNNCLGSHVLILDAYGWCSGVFFTLGCCRVWPCGDTCAARAVSGGISSNSSSCFGCFFAFTDCI